MQIDLQFLDVRSSRSQGKRFSDTGINAIFRIKIPATLSVSNTRIQFVMEWMSMMYIITVTYRKWTEEGKGKANGKAIAIPVTGRGGPQGLMRRGSHIF
jgi:hypothetical protein